MPSRVLIADDDRAIRESLARALELEGYVVATVVDGVEALTRARQDTFDALVVDVMMPGVDGLAVCRVLRADGDRTPVLMLTARVETPDRVAGLDAGADDYLPKPFELDELLARLRALLRRAAPAPSPADGVLRIAALRIDPAARQAWWADEELQLSKTEFDLLELMARRDGRGRRHHAARWRPSPRRPGSRSATGSLSVLPVHHDRVRGFRRIGEREFVHRSPSAVCRATACGYPTLWCGPRPHQRDRVERTPSRYTPRSRRYSACGT